MASQKQLLHFVLLPHLAHGHLIPMIDMARLLAHHGVTVTIVTTTLNATRFRSTIDRAIDSGLQIQLLQVPFPSNEAGLPEGCESMDTLPSRDSFKNLLVAISMLQSPMEILFNDLQPRISCIISDKNLPWTAETATKLCIPRLVFDGTSCFSLLCTHNILNSGIHESVNVSQPFLVPGLPDQIELTRAQLPNAVNMHDARDMRSKIREAEVAAYGVVVNTFEELEAAYIEEFRKARGCKVWCIGPVSLCNKDNVDRIERGNKTSMDENQLVKWLDSKENSSVVYTCLGSQSRLTAPQLIELGLGLEASKQPFIWVIRGGNKSQELEEWITQEGYEERTKRERPFDSWLGTTNIDFVTSGNWRVLDTLWLELDARRVCAGVPMITWPLFAEQFYNEKFMVHVLKIGVRVGAEFAVKWGEEEKFGVLVKREEVEKAIQQLMDEGEEGQGRRKRARELGKMTNRALEEGGSSFLDMTMLIQDIMQQVVINN